jgi:hypothetical protein
MSGPEFSDKRHNRVHRRFKVDPLEQAIKRFGFSVSFIEDNLIHVRDAAGHEVAFEFPMGNIELDRYDQFIQQMQDENRPLPDITQLELSIAKPRTDALRATALSPAADNSITRPRTWADHAQDHDVSVDELKEMYSLARRRLYDRFRRRLRP